MTEYEKYSLIISVIALLLSAVAFFLSYKSNRIATDANKINVKAIETDVKIAQRQNVINLSSAWRGTSLLSEPIIIPDLVSAVNALSETATGWNHDIVDKVIIDQMYYNSFCRVYDFIQSKREEFIPSLSTNYRALLTEDIQRAYHDMKQFHLSQVVQTKIL